ncbi:MAG: GNAT family N-acetyltransferase [Chloroflexota bacterium]
MLKPRLFVRSQQPMTLPPYTEGDMALRPIRERHARGLFAIVDSDRAYLRRWQNWPDTIRTLKHMRDLIRHSHQKSRTHSGFDAVIYYRGELAGKIGLVFIDWQAGRAEIGYWLGERFQGHGLITRATRVITGHVLGPMGLSCVQIRCAAENVRSRAVPERLGFRYDGVLPYQIWLHGELHDDTLYTMTATEWFNRMIYHITAREDWERARRNGIYEPASLATEGFIHASKRDQVVRVADAVFANRTDLLLLVIDPARLASELREEPPDLSVPAEHVAGETFPHIYGPLNLNAVVDVIEFPSGLDGRFELPPPLD